MCSMLPFKQIHFLIDSSVIEHLLVTRFGARGWNYPDSEGPILLLHGVCILDFRTEACTFTLGRVGTESKCGPWGCWELAAPVREDQEGPPSSLICRVTLINGGG